MLTQSGKLKITRLNEDWWIGVSAFQAFAFQSESIPGPSTPSTPAQGVSALSGLNSGRKSGSIGHEAIGIPFGNHMRLRNKTCANAKRHNPKLLTPQPQSLRRKMRRSEID